MAWIKIVAYAVDFQPGSTGIVYFKCQGETIGRKTPELQPEVFNAVCAVLKRGAVVFETDNHIFRSDGYNADQLAPMLERFPPDEFQNVKNFKTWNLPGK